MGRVKVTGRGYSDVLTQKEVKKENLKQQIDNAKIIQNKEDLITDEDIFSFIYKSLMINRVISPSIAARMITIRLISPLYDNISSSTLIIELMVDSLVELFTDYLKNIDDDLDNGNDYRFDFINTIILEIFNILHCNKNQIDRINNMMRNFRDYF